MKNDDINWNRNHHRGMRQFTLEQESHFAQILWQRFPMKIMFKVDFVKREVWGPKSERILIVYQRVMVQEGNA